MRRRKRRKGKDKVVGKENNSIIKHTRIYLSSKEGREAGKPTLCTCSTIKTAGLKVRKGGDEGRVTHSPQAYARSPDLPSPASKSQPQSGVYGGTCNVRATKRRIALERFAWFSGR